MPTITETHRQIITDFNSIKTAIEDKGVVVGEAHTSDYAAKIADIVGLDFDNIDYLFKNNSRKVSDIFSAINWNEIISAIEAFNYTTFEQSTSYTIKVGNWVTRDMLSHVSTKNSPSDTSLYAVLNVIFTYLNTTGNHDYVMCESSNIKFVLNNLAREIFDKAFTNSQNIIVDVDGLDTSETQLSLDFNEAFKNVNGFEILFTNGTKVEAKRIKNMFNNARPSYNAVAQNLDLSWLDLSDSNISSQEHMNEQAFTGIKVENLTLDMTVKKAGIYKMFNESSSLVSVTGLKVEQDSYSTLTGGRSNERAFYNCTHLQSIICNTQWVFAGTIKQLFKECYLLATIPSIKFLHYSSANYDIEGVFSHCRSLTTIDIEIIYEGSYNNLAARYMFEGCEVLAHITGELDLSKITECRNMFDACYLLEDIETTGSFGGDSSSGSLTLDLSASPVFDIADYITRLAANNSGNTRIIKLNSTVYSNMTQATIDLATTKNYTLQSA